MLNVYFALMTVRFMRFENVSFRSKMFFEDEDGFLRNATKW